MTRIKISALVLGAALLLGAPSAARAQAVQSGAMPCADRSTSATAMWPRRIDDLAHERALARRWTARQRADHFGIPCAAPAAATSAPRMPPNRSLAEVARARREARAADRVAAR